MSKKQTNSFNKIQSEINNINTKLNGMNLKIGLKTEQTSLHWYEYILYSVQNSPNGKIVENKIFSGKPEAVIGYLKGFNDALYLFNR